jgi:wyosine [tRNA(Phe)-imidazoG37] synthetase (radical SAM superfamily)
MNSVKHVFGPVPSRRLGISLGVDVIPFKTCSLDCIYCECGKTTNISLQRRSFVSVDVILQEVRKAVEGDRYIEYITFSGSGEPTLSKDIGGIIQGIKAMTDIPVAVLTNGTLLFMDDVQEALLTADLVLPSLDAATPESFNHINRPHKDLDLEKIIQGLITFSSRFSGQLWVEVFIVAGVNDSDDELDRLHGILKQINPTRVQLNSLDRPPAYENVLPVDTKVLRGIEERWSDLPVEVIKRVRKRGEIAAFSRNLENSILNTVNRRPLTIEDLVALTGKNRVELFKYIDILEKEKKIYARIVGNHIFYAPVNQ